MECKFFKFILDPAPIKPLLMVIMCMIGETGPYFLSQITSLDINHSEDEELVEWIVQKVTPCAF